MIWQLVILSLSTCVHCTVGQAKYRAYEGPPVVPVITKDGFLADTKEVADAKQYFLNALAKAAAEVKDQGPRGYTGSSQLQRVYEPVPLHQVPYQRPQHQQAQYQHQQPQPQHYQPQATLLHRAQPQAAAAAALYRPQPTQPAPVYEDDVQYDDGEYREEPQYAQLPQAAPTPTRPDPNVTPIILENGYIADTQEVNAAKAEHFAAVARAHELVARAQQRTAQTGGYRGAPAQTVAPQLRQPQPQAYNRDPSDY